MAFNAAKLRRIVQLVIDTDYEVEHRPTVRVRGWPTPSAKPFALYLKGGKHLASFATVEGLERNVRARLGC